jgi:hypothetical protein
MRKIIAIVIALLCFSTASYSAGRWARFGVKLEKVLINGKMYNADTVKNTFENENVMLRAGCDSKMFYVELTNRSFSSFFLDWNKASLIYTDGTSVMVHSNDLQYNLLNNAPALQPIPADSKTLLSIVPNKRLVGIDNGNCHYSDKYGDTDNIIAETDSKKSLLEDYQCLVGKSLKIYLPVCNSNNIIVNEYTLYLKVTSIEVI